MSQRIKVAKTTQLRSGQGCMVEVKGRQIALFNVGGAFYAIDNACSHSRGPLAEGRLIGATVTCPWHGAQFEVTTGKRLREPATSDVTNYAIHIEGDIIFVEIP